MKNEESYQDRTEKEGEDKADSMDKERRKCIARLAEFDDAVSEAGGYVAPLSNREEMIRDMKQYIRERGRG